MLPTAAGMRHPARCGPGYRDLTSLWYGAVVLDYVPASKEVAGAVATRLVGMAPALSPPVSTRSCAAAMGALKRCGRPRNSRLASKALPEVTGSSSRLGVAA